jgi:hypothetical protein
MTAARATEYVCDQLVRAEARTGRIALVFENVTIILSVECARAVADILDELREIDDAG